ncbi:MAG: hypothetical protein AAFN77_22680 [Planctomycetota bacterium]
MKTLRSQFGAANLTALIASGQHVSETIFVATMLTCFLLFGWLTAIITKPFARQFASDFKTFRGLSKRVLVLNAIHLKDKHGPMGPNDIWVLLRDLIVDQLGVDADEVTPTANFVKDLGCD